jgi:HK97 family phage major capsid protein
MSISNSADRASTLNTAHRILDAAKAAGRDLTESEQAEVEAAITRVREFDTHTKSGTLRALLDASRIGDNEPVADPDRGGGLFTTEAKSGITHAFKTRTAYRTTVDIKSALVGGTLLPTSGTGVVPGLYPSSVVALAGLFANEPAAGPSQRYYTFGGATAAVVAEGTEKPASGMAITPHDAVLVKLAVVQSISTELEMDAPQVVGQIGQELLRAVAVAENAHIVGAWGAAVGIDTDTSTDAELIDKIADAIATQTSASGAAPGAVVLSPTVLSTLRKFRGAPGGNYIFDPLTAAPTAVHGIGLVPSSAVADDEVWVVSREACTVFRRGPAGVEFGLSGDDFTFNLTTMRCEERLVCAVQRPGLITQITIDNTP